jgi:hypothetical protein
VGRFRSLGSDFNNPLSSNAGRRWPSVRTRNDVDMAYVLILAPAFTSELCLSFRPRQQRGRREGRVPIAPMARVQKKMHAAVTTGTSRTSGLPCAMALRLIRALLGDRRSCPRRLARCASIIAKLGVSSGTPGPHDFTVRISLFVGAIAHAATRYAHRIPRSTSVTVATRPSCETGRRQSVHEF